MVAGTGDTTSRAAGAASRQDRGRDWWGPSPPDDTVTSALHRCVEAVPDRTFLDLSGKTWTYGAMWQAATELARGLRHVGVGPGHTVVTMLDNNADGVAAWVATNLLGAIWVPINTALRGEFLRHVVADTGARVVVCESDLAGRLALVGEGLDGVELVAVRGGDADLRAVGPLPAAPLDELRVAGGDERWRAATPDDVACLIYTGGTTGPSKGCVMTHGYVFSSARGFLQQTGRTADELNWSPLPMYHFNLVSGTILGTVLLRGTASIAPRFSVSRFWPEVERTGARMVNLLGSMGSMIAQMPDTPEMAGCRGQVRVVHGAPFPAELQRVWRERFGAQIVGGNTYGLTEATPLTTLPAGEPAPPGTSGRPNEASFDVRLFDDDGREVAPGEVGEVVCRPRRSNVMFQGYWRRPDATVAVTRDLWFRTGDLGRFDEAGFFTFVDRKKDYLRRRGENVSSQELEATYLAHPEIAQVAAHAVPSDVTEDDIKVTAVLVGGSGLTPRDLFEWSKDRVPYFALPRYIEFRTELPLSPVGRVHKFRLRDEGCTPATWDREQDDVTWERR